MAASVSGGCSGWPAGPRSSLSNADTVDPPFAGSSFRLAARLPGRPAPKRRRGAPRAGRSGRALAPDEADLPARLEDRPAHLRERGDVLQAGSGLDLLDRDPLALHVLVDRDAVLDEQQRAPLEQRPHAPEAVAEKRTHDRQQREGRDDEEGPG